MQAYGCNVKTNMNMCSFIINDAIRRQILSVTPARLFAEGLHPPHGKMMRRRFTMESSISKGHGILRNIYCVQWPIQHTCGRQQWLDRRDAIKAANKTANKPECSLSVTQKKQKMHWKVGNKQTGGQIIWSIGGTLVVFLQQLQQPHSIE